MRLTSLIRMAGLAALLAGALSLFSAFLFPVGVGWLNLVVDIAIMFGLVGIYANQYAESGIWGLIGFLLSVAGFQTRHAEIEHVIVSVLAAIPIGVGLMFLAIGSWKAGKLPRYVSALWIVSAVASWVSFGRFLSEPVYGAPHLIAGVAFLAGFMGAGLQLLRVPLHDVR